MTGNTGLGLIVFCCQYEQMGAECCSTLGINEIDKPDLVEDRFRGVKRKQLELPVSRTLRRWVEKHGEEIDERK